jgi:hypothetical protein
MRPRLMPLTQGWIALCVTYMAVGLSRGWF